MIAASKGYQAGVIRAMLYQRIDDTVSIPSLDVNIGVKALTTALADFLNKISANAISSSKLVQPLIDASGVHLTNIDDEGSIPAKHCDLGFICLENLHSCHQG